jgi:hypothetical protein
MAESGGLPGYDAAQWQGLVAPAGTPAEVVARINAELNRRCSSRTSGSGSATWASSFAPTDAGELHRRYQGGHRQVEPAHQDARHPPRLTALYAGIHCICLPATSPIRAAMAMAGRGIRSTVSLQPSCGRHCTRALSERRDADIAAALRAAPTRDAYLHLWNAVCDVAHSVDPDPAAVSTRVFALPLVIVTGSPGPAVLPGVLPDAGAVAALFGHYGVLGKTANFGFSNALCALDTLERVQPGEVYEWTHATAAGRRELAPDPVVIAGPGEEVHLRFLVGAGIVGGAEPSFVETASNIGAWGMPLTRALAAQLAQPGVEALPLPRPPLELLRAAHAGRSAQLEAAFQRLREQRGAPFPHGLGRSGRRGQRA